VLELSGGVRSLPQVPQWNAVRRARSAEREPHPLVRKLGEIRAWRRSASFLFALQTHEGSETEAEQISQFEAGSCQWL
jgi:hypothetical protein